MKIEKFIVIAATALQCIAAGGQSLDHDKNFSDFPAQVYHGSIKIPDYYKKDGDYWRDDMGKAVAPPDINFAGKYYISLHGCGTDCRYFTLSDLATGKDSDALNIFTTGDDAYPAKTPDGQSYTVDLISHPDSSLLIARYSIDESATQHAECKERLFVLDTVKMKVNAINSTFRECSGMK